MGRRGALLLLALLATCVGAGTLEFRADVHGLAGRTAQVAVSRGSDGIRAAGLHSRLDRSSDDPALTRAARHRVDRLVAVLALGALVGCAAVRSSSDADAALGRGSGRRRASSRAPPLSSALRS